MFALWLPKKATHHFLNQSEIKQNQSLHARSSFPTLDASYVCLLRLILLFATVVTGPLNNYGFWFYDTQLKAAP